MLTQIALVIVSAAIAEATCCRKTNAFPSCSISNAPCIPYDKEECVSKGCEYFHHELESGPICKDSCNWVKTAVNLSIVPKKENAASQAAPPPIDASWKDEADNLESILEDLPFPREEPKAPSRRKVKGSFKIILPKKENATAENSAGSWELEKERAMKTASRPHGVADSIEFSALV